MLKRSKQTMKNYVLKALKESNTYNDYCSRPEYQQNDYLAWIYSAKQETTKQKRLQQMIDELRLGGVYMKMQHPPSVKNN